MFDLIGFDHMHSDETRIRVANQRVDGPSAFQLRMYDVFVNLDMEDPEIGPLASLSFSESSPENFDPVLQYHLLDGRGETAATLVIPTDGSQRSIIIHTDQIESFARDVDGEYTFFLKKEDDERGDFTPTDTGQSTLGF